MGIPWYTNPLRFLRPSKILGAAKNKTSQVRINHHFPWVFYGFPLFSMGFPWFSIVFHGFPWVFLGSPSGYPAFSIVFPSSGSLSSAPPVIPRGSHVLGVQRGAFLRLQALDLHFQLWIHRLVLEIDILWDRSNCRIYEVWTSH